MDYTARYNNLNAAQKKAVDAIDGPVMVIAGPGTGKTELLSMRAATILKRTDTLPENILCLTFTDSGAAAMQKRLASIIGTNGYKVAIHTFHSFGSDIMSQYGHYFYEGAHFRPSDELSSYEMMQTIFDELDRNNPLASTMNGAYTHLGDTLTTISELKKSGLTSDELLKILDANDEIIDSCEKLLQPVFLGRVNKMTAGALADALTQIEQLPETRVLPTIAPFATVIISSLRTALTAADADNSTKPITAWRSFWMKKNDSGSLVLKSRERQQKLRAVSYVYYQYLSRMQEAELYDFDDMILRVVHAMEVFPELRLNLQEKYHYIMVDEFQDTNLAQMRILYDLTDNAASEDKPNIMVVGDDDQAIYSFQGADVGNISQFREHYQLNELIALTDNYRSTATILERSRNVITLGADRLENTVPELNKTLIARDQAQSDSVTLYQLPSQDDERAWLVSKIKSAIECGIAAPDIAVLARRHDEVIALLPYFADAGIAVSYERRDSVLDLPVIKIIEQIGKCIVALHQQQHDLADSLLPEILAHPAFAIAPLDLWRLSVSAKTAHTTWMEAMVGKDEFGQIHSWLLGLAEASVETPLEYMIAHIIGMDDNPDAYKSPLTNYYFGPNALESNPEQYLTYLEALRTIRTKLREYKPTETPYLPQFIDFIMLHRQRASTITAVRGAGNESQAVQLMTVHKSKGLEFDHVYICGVIDSKWGERVRGRSRLINYPENLPLAPSGDSFDERLRLFYVAMTRAKKQLHISYSVQSDAGKELLPASFISDDAWTRVHIAPVTGVAQRIKKAELEWYAPIIEPISQSMRAVLAPTLENYKLSVTHLNNFLDVSRGGPQKFLMNNLLRFPSTKSAQSAYGVAIHAALQRAHSHLAATASLRPEEDVFHDFEQSLKQQFLPEVEFQQYLQKGSETLEAFLSIKYSSFTQSQRVEVNFAHQAVYIGEAHLTGALDLMDFNDSEIIVTDYKTGKPSRSWTGKTDFEKIKLHKYRQQLMFYELLIKKSRDYAKYKSVNGVLQFVEPTRSGEIVELSATFTADELERFARLVEKVWHCVMTLDLPDVSGFGNTYQGMLDFEKYLLDE